MNCNLAKKAVSYSHIEQTISEQFKTILHSQVIIIIKIIIIIIIIFDTSIAHFNIGI